jgi:hypothetical protein|nr:MAG TPA: hypothetical protein [Caudoviricetes sp.]
MSIVDKYIAWQLDCGAVVNAHNTKVTLAFSIVIALIGLLMLAVGLIARRIEGHNNPYSNKIWSATLSWIGALLIGIPILFEAGSALVSYLYSIL